MEPGPNDLCPCGSGKKFKKCHMNRKPREWSINVEFEKPATQLRIGAFSNGNIQAFDNDGTPVKPAKVRHEVSYKREKKKKVINKIELDSTQFDLNPDESLQKFDVIYAIDTNTKATSSKLLSVAGITVCIIEHVEDGVLDTWHKPFRALEFWNIKDHPENVAWMTVIQFLTQDPTYDPSSKIGIIVDSDLGNLPAYNARSMPIYSDFYLPENFELIYASAEVGQEEFFINYLISISEDMAKSLLARILLNENSDTDLQEANNEPYSHIRIWNYP